MADRRHRRSATTWEEVAASVSGWLLAYREGGTEFKGRIGEIQQEEAHIVFRLCEVASKPAASLAWRDSKDHAVIAETCSEAPPPQRLTDGRITFSNKLGRCTIAPQKKNAVKRAPEVT